MNTDRVRETHANDAGIERLWSHTVGIANSALGVDGTDPYTGRPAHECEAPGTGVAGRWGRHHFVLTAKHVIDQAELKDLNFFSRPTGAFTRASEVTMKDALMASPIPDEGSVVHRCDWEDLALITMKPDALSSHLEFADLANSWLDPAEGEMVVGLGFPVSSASMFQRRVGQRLEKAVLLSPIGFSGKVLPHETGRWFSDYDTDRHYLIPYDLATRGNHPGGISGAAVWVWSTENDLVWSAQFAFAGICTSCYRNGSVEKVVAASTVRRFLIEAFGNQ